MKICSLVPGATEVVAALGCQDNLIGISHECDFPPSLAQIPVMVRPRIESHHLSSVEIDQQVGALLAADAGLYELDETRLLAAGPDLILGIALQKPGRPVYCLDGDGALLMHMGALAITGALKPRNFKHIIVNNGAHDSVGGQPTVAFDVDVPGIAHASGYESVFCAQTKQELQSRLAE